MLKRRIAILFLTLAYALLLGHDIIPHHHHDNLQELNDHHANNHNQARHHHGNDLGHLLSHFLHSADDFIPTSTPSGTNSFLKQHFSFVAVLPNHLALNEILIPPLLHKSPAEHLIYISPHAHPSGLREPPAAFI